MNPEDAESSGLRPTISGNSLEKVNDLRSENTMSTLRGFFNGTLLFVLAGGMLSVTAAQTANSSSSSMAGTSSQTAAQMSPSDKTFVKKAAEGGIAEVELGKLATEKAASQDVKRFGQRMIDDHSKANDELQQVAQTQGITLPTQPSPAEKDEKERLSKLSGQQFDKVYMATMLKDHRKDIAEFRQEGKSGRDTAIKDFAKQTLPTLESHLKEAETIAPKEGVQTSAARQQAPTTK
jgi:putative membrane protein